MFFNVFSSLSTRQPTAPTTPFKQQPSKLRGAVQSIFGALHLRRSTSTHPSTGTRNVKIISTAAVPLKTATPSTTASVVAFATISPLFVAQHTESTPPPPPSAAADQIAALKENAELKAAVASLKRQQAHQARVMNQLDDLVSAGIANFLSQRDAEVEARRVAEERLATEIASRKRAEKWLLEEQDRCWDMEYEAEKVFRGLEEAKKKKEALEEKIFDLEHRSNSDLLAPDLLLEALERLGFVNNTCDPDRCPLPGSCLPLFLEEVYTGVVLRDAGIAGRSAAGYWPSADSEDED